MRSSRCIKRCKSCTAAHLVCLYPGVGQVDPKELESMRHQLEDAHRWNASLHARLGAIQNRGGGDGGKRTKHAFCFIGRKAPIGVKTNLLSCRRHFEFHRGPDVVHEHLRGRWADERQPVSTVCAGAPTEGDVSKVVGTGDVT